MTTQNFSQTTIVINCEISNLFDYKTPFLDFSFLNLGGQACA